MPGRNSGGTAFPRVQRGGEGRQGGRDSRSQTALGCRRRRCRHRASPSGECRGERAGAGAGPLEPRSGPLVPSLPVSGRPPPHRRPEAARGRGHVSRAAPPPAGPLRRRPGGTQRDSQAPLWPHRVHGGCTGLRGGRAFYSLVQTTRMGLSGPRPVWPSPACPSPASSAGRLAGRPQPHVLPPASDGSGDGQAPPGPFWNQHWVRALSCRSPGL